MTDHEFKPKLRTHPWREPIEALPYASDVPRPARQDRRPTTAALPATGCVTGSSVALPAVHSLHQDWSLPAAAAPSSRRAIPSFDGAPAHLRYILRNGITPDGQPGRL